MFDLSVPDQAAADIVEHTERSIERPDEQGKANPGSRAAVGPQKWQARRPVLFISRILRGCESTSGMMLYHFCKIDLSRTLQSNPAWYIEINL